ncbi:MAG TPA: sialidase family protein [Thermoanaerobaculia bacterium]|nr:sialidase family protein [Thermoanaerobaculia bacterium]HUM30835.1 sialidase family protein [Thermoanaerobaculia bacterium]HXK69184.1 sialidase family protein [Thermoanaerobaculia bacterium]
MRYGFLILLTLSAITLGIVLTSPLPTMDGGARPPLVKLERDYEPDNIYFDPAWRILPQSWRPYITRTEPAEFQNLIADETPCREVQTTSSEADIVGEGTMQNEVSLAVSGSTIVVTYNDDNEINSANSVSGFSVSTDGGKTFTDRGAIMPSNDYFGGGDPMIVADPYDPNHFIYLQLTYNVQLRPDTYSPSSIVLHHSYDGGQTFLPENSIDVLQGKRHPDKPSEPAVSGKGFHDKEWMSYDPVNNTVIISWSYFYQQLDGTDEAFPAILVSRDGGYTFDDPVNPLPQGQWGGLVATATGPNGELYVVFNDFQTSRLLFTRSLDGGTTWEGPFQATGIFQQPGYFGRCGYYFRIVLKGNIRITSIPSMAVDPVTGEIYVVYNYMPDSDNSDAQYTYDPNTDYSNIAFIRSSDQGATWSSPVTINDDTTLTDQFMPWVASAGDGNVAVMFYDRRNDPTNTLMHVYLARSFDGGRTWLRNQPVTCQAFPPAADAGCYMGDYNQMVVTEDGYHMAWGDNRNLQGGVPNADVFWAKVKIRPHVRPFNFSD